MGMVSVEKVEVFGSFDCRNDPKDGKRQNQRTAKLQSRGPARQDDCEAGHPA